MDGSTALPETLSQAIATEPTWLVLWVRTLIGTHALGLLFIVGRDSGRWRFRAEPLAIVVSFVVAAQLMGWMYGEIGYVRMLGLAHLLVWGPVWGYVLARRREIGTASLFGKYVHLYLVVAGISLAIDALDVVRYLVGDGELLGRWG